MVIGSIENITRFRYHCNQNL